VEIAEIGLLECAETLTVNEGVKNQSACE
jgi:hypothetical protein